MQDKLGNGCKPTAQDGQRRPLSRVVAVEDDPDIRAVVDLALGHVGGLAVTCCDGGRVALEVVPAIDPDLVLLDVMMPGMDGLETLTRLRLDPRNRLVRVVFMTARVQPHHRADYLARGALGVIAKPFDPLTLAQQLRQLHATVDLSRGSTG
ncbi:MAG: response regulator [Geminicoccaceae bacterium]|jgi:CheY-like chemotaxis protein|nr:response regulator [Geminicoccaceae bacterium]MCP5230612.1 response regulator [Zoogloeaceae bacterium]